MYHVTSRGVRKADVFTDVRDRVRFQQIFQNVVERHEWRCHTYCLMTNHFHFLIETPRADISDGMQRLNGIYAQWFNWRHGFEGHLFDRRFGSVLIEGHAHLLELTRYVVLNPVRAGLCRHPGEWRWSSYSAMVGERDRPAFLQTAWALSLFSKEPKRARELYREFVASAPPRYFERVLGSGTRTRPDWPNPHAQRPHASVRVASE
jgi:putative transposase